MPLYEYICESCGRRFELIRKFSDAPLEKCPTCGGQVQKQASSPAIQFKGTGWYVTDYAKKSGGEGSTSDKKGSGETGKGESGKSETGTSETDTTTSKSSDSGTSAESKPSTSTPSSTTDGGSKNSSKDS